MEIYQEGFRQPRFMLLGPSNEILLSDTGGGNGRDPMGTVYVLNGKERRPVIQNLIRPYGLAVHDGYLYVGTPESIKRWKYDTKAQTVSGEGQEIISLKGMGQGHWTRSLLFSRDGKKLFVGQGSGSNVNAGEDPHRAAITTYNPDGSGREIYASGTRNPIGLKWYPGTDTLWAAVQERDELGDDLVPDYFTHIQKGAFYGWPYAYTGPHEDPRAKAKDPIWWPNHPGDVLLGSHVAVLDFTSTRVKCSPPNTRAARSLPSTDPGTGPSGSASPSSSSRSRTASPRGPLEEIVTGWMLGPDRAKSGAGRSRSCNCPTAAC